MNRYKQLALNSLLFFINAIATKLITFLLVPLYTYFMSAGEFGLTDMSLTVINLATPLFTLSIAEAAVRFIVGDRKRADEYVCISLLITALSVLVVALISPLLGLGVFGGLGDYKSWFVCAYAASAFMNLCSEMARGIGEVKLIPICAGVSSVATLLSAVLFIGTFGMRLTGYFISVTLGPVLAIFLYMSFGGLAQDARAGAVKLMGYEKEEVKDLLRPMLRYALPLIPNNLFWWLSTGINRFFITGMLGIATSGMFAAASKIPNLLNTIYSVFQQAWQLSAYQESEKGRIESFFSTVFHILQAVITIFCALLSYFAPLVASFMLQGETFSAWPMIGILLLANLFSVFASFYGTVYSTTMHTSFIMKTTMFGALACVVITPALIPVLGVIGACVASAFGQILVFVMRVLDSKKYICISVGWKYLVPTLLFLLIQALATSSLIDGWNYISGVCASAVIGIQLFQLISTLHSRGKRIFICSHADGRSSR